MVVGQKQDKELESEYNAREKLPPLCLKNSPLLKQASQVYTSTIFKVFQNEYDYASVAIITDWNCSQPVHELCFLRKLENIKYCVVLLVGQSHAVVGSLKHLGFCVSCFEGF